ncbi:MAG TPA: hypothetical protein VFC78_24200 [Tepidisphaeraceae bacterium]|nr:hypothetical protein [Tepidisphaeraceae bacterium]
MKRAFLSAVVALLFALPVAWAQKPPEKPVAKEPVAPSELKARLHKVLPVVSFKAVALSEVFEFLHDASGADLFIDWKRLEKAGVLKKAPITYQAKKREFGEVLSDILKLAGGNKPLAYCVDHQLTIISTKGGAAAIQETFQADDKLWKPIEAGPGFKGILPEVSFDVSRLADVIDFLKDVSGAKIEVDWAAFAKAGVNRDTPIGAKLGNVTFGRALRIVLLSATDKPANITVVSGAIHVAPSVSK